jgi:hypothetical protein
MDIRVAAIIAAQQTGDPDSRRDIPVSRNQRSIRMRTCSRRRVSLALWYNNAHLAMKPMGNLVAAQASLRLASWPHATMVRGAHDVVAFIRFAFRDVAIVLAQGRPHAIARCNPCPGASCSSRSAISVRTLLVTASRAGSRRSTIPTTSATTPLTIAASSLDRGAFLDRVTVPPSSTEGVP